MSEENILSTSVPIKLDGQEFILRYRALAFIRYAEQFKGDLFADIHKLVGYVPIALALAQGQIPDTPNASAGGTPIGVADLFLILRNVLWAGMIEAQPMIQVDDVVRLIDFSNLNTSLDAITAAIKRTMPESQKRPIQVRQETTSTGHTDGRDSGLSSEPLAESLPASSAA